MHKSVVKQVACSAPSLQACTLNSDTFSPAVTPNWGMQGTQSRSSLFRHVSISLYIDFLSAEPPTVSTMQRLRDCLIYLSSFIN